MRRLGELDVAVLVEVDFLAKSEAASPHSLRDGAGGPAIHTFNLGTGQGFSIREVLAAVKDVTGRVVPYVLSGRRAGDPAVLVADSSKAQEQLGWKMRNETLLRILRTAWKWANRGLPTENSKNLATKPRSNPSDTEEI